MRFKHIVMTLSVLAVGAGTIGAAQADSGNGEARHRTHHVGGFNGDDQAVYRDYRKVYQSQNQPVNVRVAAPVVLIDKSDRTVIRRYMVERHSSTCPAGTAQRQPGCLPVAVAAPAYGVGRTLADNIVYQPVAQPLLVRLSPVPVGYRYVQVDNDILLISDNRQIVDAVTWTSAIGQ